MAKQWEMWWHSIGTLFGALWKNSVVNWGAAFTTRTLNVRGNPLGTNFKEVRSEKRKFSIQICIAIQHHYNKKGLAVGVGDCVCCVSTVHCTRELCVGNSVAHLAATQSLPTLDSWIQMLPSSILRVVIQYHLPAPLWTCDLSVKAYGSLCWNFQFFQVTCHCVGLARMLSLFGLHPIQFWAH